MLNVILLHCGCPRVVIKETAVQLFHILYRRFFFDQMPLSDINECAEHEDSIIEDEMMTSKDKDTKDRFCLQQQLISGPYCRSQKYISETLAKLHPDMTMPMFSGKYNIYAFHFMPFNLPFFIFLILIKLIVIVYFHNVQLYIHFKKILPFLWRVSTSMQFEDSKLLKHH